jgi:hypothetical protein
MGEELTEKVKRRFKESGGSGLEPRRFSGQGPKPGAAHGYSIQRTTKRPRSGRNCCQKPFYCCGSQQGQILGKSQQRVIPRIYLGFRGALVVLSTRLVPDADSQRHHWVV